MRQSEKRFQALVALFVGIALASLPQTVLGQAKSQAKTIDAKRNANRRIAVAATNLSRDLEEAKNLLSGVSDVRLRAKLEALLGRAQANLGVMRTDLFLGETRWTILSDAGFAKLVQQVKAQGLSSKKSRFLTSYANLALSSRSGDRLSSAQVKRLIAEVDLDSDRVAAAAALFDLTTDKQNFLTALDAITFERNRKLVKSRIGLDRKN